MNALEIPAQEASPFVKFTPNGKLEIKGKSYDEDVISIYKLIMDKLQEYSATTAKELNVNIYLKYFNTASSKCLYDLLLQLKNLQDTKGISLKLEWNYIEGDDDMKEEIEDFKDQTELDFQIVPEKDYFNLKP